MYSATLLLFVNFNDIIFNIILKRVNEMIWLVIGLRRFTQLLQLLLLA